MRSNIATPPSHQDVHWTLLRTACAMLHCKLPNVHYPNAMRLRFFSFARNAFFIALLALGCCLGWQTTSLAYEKVETVLPPPPGNFTKERLEELELAITDTGMTRDAIPPIERPVFITVENAKLSHEPGDMVFVLESSDPPRIYPRLTLLWHGVVNEPLADAPTPRRSVTYCPITGTLVAYSGQINDMRTTFGTHGGLLNNNMVLYDRTTGTVWSQLGGLGLSGMFQGKRLQPIPLLWTTFERATTRYPKAQVLSRTTGHRRNYNRDPYGSYARNGTYYQNERIVHPVVHRDERLPAKEPVLGLIFPDLVVAVVHAPLQQAMAANFNAGTTPVVALWDSTLHTARLFDRRMDGEALTFADVGGEFYDNATKTLWSAEGVGLQGRHTGRRLSRLPTTRSMWFAWSAFFPETSLYNWSPSVERQALDTFRKELPDRLQELLFPERGGL